MSLIRDNDCFLCLYTNLSSKTQCKSSDVTNIFQSCTWPHTSGQLSSYVMRTCGGRASCTLCVCFSVNMAEAPFIVLFYTLTKFLDRPTDKEHRLPPVEPYSSRWHGGRGETKPLSIYAYFRAISRHISFRLSYNRVERRNVLRESERESPGISGLVSTHEDCSRTGWHFGIRTAFFPLKNYILFPVSSWLYSKLNKTNLKPVL